MNSLRHLTDKEISCIYSLLFDECCYMNDDLLSAIDVELKNKLVNPETVTQYIINIVYQIGQLIKRHVN